MGFFKKKNLPTFPVPPAPYHTLPVNQVSIHTKTDIDDGLTPQEAAQRLELYGFNELSGQGNVSVFAVLYRQIVNALTLVLVIAMVISFVFKDYVEGAVIAFVAVTNTLIGFTQEYSAEKTMESLRRMASPTTRVIRGDSLISVSTRDIVIGDIIVFEEGDVIGADARLFEVFNLEVDEALLTGESIPVAKSVNEIEDHDKPLGDRIDMVFSSTTVTKGRGKGIAVNIGMKTEIGKIAKTLASTSVVTRTPLQKKLEILAYALFGLAIILAIIVFGVNKWLVNNEVVIYAISLGISVIPEGLVAVITLTMAFGVRQMAKNYAIVRKLNALEALGSVTNICSDKTGTLTQSKMIATDAWLPGDGLYRISGRNGFSPEGKIYRCGTNGTNETSEIEVEDEEVTSDNMRYAFTRLVQASALCNMAVIKKGKGDDEWHAIGDPTESALQVFAHKAGLSKPVLTAEPFKFELVQEYAFDTELKRMSVVCKEKSTDAYYVFLKGATESVLNQCTKIQFGENEVNLDREKFGPELYNELEKLASKGMRVLSLAYRRVIKSDIEISKWTREKADTDMIFLGLVGIYDPPRPESKAAIQRCFGAGIEVHMLTGDHPTTASAIAKEIGILPLLWSPELENEGKFNSQLVMTAAQFDALSDAEVDNLSELPKVIARCIPDTKVKMIDALHRRNKYVAMTGDGVNDSPSLKKADVGIAMGLGGSDVAKQASDIVLSDDNFATIVNAIAEGRRIFSNIQKFILHLLSGNAGEIVTLIIGLSFIDSDGISVNPMSPLQILFLNMVTSSPPAMGLGVERASGDIMRYPPRSKGGLFTWEVIIDMIYYGIVLGGLSLANFVIVIYAIGNGNLGQNCNSSPYGQESLEIACHQIYRARGTTFATFTYILLIHAYNCRSLRDPIWTMKLYDNKILFWSVFGGLLTAIPTFYIPELNSKVFKQLGIGYEWGLIVGAVIIFEIFVEVYKFMKRRYLKPLEIVEGEGLKRQYSLNEYP
ncbi:putative Na(+)-exporting P-type ATPase ENA5 [Rhizophagus irregularis DAOM 197198w]|uniref:P-type Na(+) transporter n=1 Tax=Rhizophagus irregularis (strain DAOM 197198w) TaxID=1432141 RepID=A0A015II85_RHIIW|nr:putative Na(+)-exporting P-type ATPase ENA5 [Rhizophagus irregularis DAOM 197198w]